jgi:hypothetical protein
VHERPRESPVRTTEGLDGLSQDAGHSCLPRSGRRSTLGVGGGCAKEGASCNNAFASLHCRGDGAHTDGRAGLAPPGQPGGAP